MHRINAIEQDGLPVVPTSPLSELSAPTSPAVAAPTSNGHMDDRYDNHSSDVNATAAVNHDGGGKSASTLHGSARKKPPSARSRRASSNKSEVKVKVKRETPGATSPVEEGDASLRLAKMLQGEQFGLRRRSR